MADPELIAPPAVPSAPADQGSLIPSPRNRRLGITLIVLPFASFVLALVILTIGGALASRGVGTQFGATPYNVARSLAGLLGIVGILGGFVLVPLGIVIMGKKELRPGAPYDERSGKGIASVIPPEIKGWNWGAAGLGWIWGLYHGVWLSLIGFVPVLNVAWWIVLGIKGNEWAWRSGKWLDVHQFQASQRKWRPWGIAVIVLSILIAFVRAARMVRGA